MIDSMSKKFEKIISNRIDFILPSPDLDSVLCGIVASHFFGHKMSGIFTKKYLILDEMLNRDDFYALDIEIFDPKIPSIGNHFCLPDYYPEIIERKLPNCINPNLFRKLGIKDYKNKYPLGTLHLLMAMAQKITNNKDEIYKMPFLPLFYADSVNALTKYGDNVKDWANYFTNTWTHDAIEYMWNLKQEDIAKNYREYREIFKNKNGANNKLLDGNNGNIGDQQKKYKEKYLEYVKLVYDKMPHSACKMNMSNWKFLHEDNSKIIGPFYEGEKTINNSDINGRRQDLKLLYVDKDIISSNRIIDNKISYSERINPKKGKKNDENSEQNSLWGQCEYTEKFSRELF